jgi:GNAT superfamily N-acetyltransferase
MTAKYPTGHALTRAVGVLRDEGVRNFWFKLLSAGGVYRRLAMLERSLTQPIAEFAPEIAINVAVLRDDELDDYFAFRPDAERTRVMERARSGDMCFAARHEGRIVSACWVARRRMYAEFLRCDIVVATDEAYFFDAFTLPSYRGRDIAPALCAHQLRHFRKAGLRRAIRATIPENAPALRAHGKNGFRPYGMLTSIGLGRWRRSFFRPGQ